MSVNIDLVGHLGQDPELKYGNDGTPRCRLRVAATPRVRNKQTEQWEDDGLSQWYSVTVFGQRAESLAASVSKGARVRVSGALVHRAWQAQDGGERVDHEIKFPDVSLYPSNSVARPTQGAGTRSQWGATSPGAWEAPRNDSVGFGNDDMDAPF